MMKTDCQNCGAEVSSLARDCPECGAPNPARRSVIVMIAALACVVVAIAIGAGFFLMSGGGQDSTAPDQRAAAAGDFSWLEKAMKDCDGAAEKTPEALHFLVTPLVDEPRDDAGWRRISLNDIDNAILINGEDMLTGLKRRALRLATDEYTFSMRPEGAKEVLSWKPAVGVRKFLYEQAAGIAQFRVQFQPRGEGIGSNWGAIFQRQPGNCYWVNAILRH